MEDKQIVAWYWQREERAITASEEKYGPVCRSVSLLHIAFCFSDAAMLK